MDYQQIQTEQSERILTITLNRPEKLNAFTATMQRELIDAFDHADADDDVRAVIVTGAGRGFCAGADLSAGAKTFDSSGTKTRTKTGKRLARRDEGGRGRIRHRIGILHFCRSAHGQHHGRWRVSHGERLR